MAGRRAHRRTGGLGHPGVDALDGYFARYLPTLILSALTPVVLLVCIVTRDWFSAVILVVTVAVIPLFMVLLGLEATRNADRQWARLSGLAATFYDLLQGMPTLRAFGRTEDGRHTLERANRELHEETMSTLKVAFLSSLALETMASVGTALVALFLGLRLLDGTLPLGTALAILVLAPEVYLPLRRAGSEFHAAAEGRAAAARILDVLRRRRPAATPADPVDRRPLPDPRRHPVRLVDVTLHHPGRTEPVLDGVDLSLAPGEHVAVVGESGAGKSTLLAVLLGFVVPERGGVWLGDELLAACSWREWRRQVAWVPQRPALVRGTIEDNLRLGNPDATDAEVTAALVRSGLDGLVGRLPDGQATPVGEGGLTLSAGERQRIAIGRAVLRDVPVVLLDEPTAHLDAAREDGLARSARPLARRPDRRDGRPPGRTRRPGRPDRHPGGRTGPVRAPVARRRGARHHGRSRRVVGVVPCVRDDAVTGDRAVLSRVLRIGAPDGPRFLLSTVLGTAAALCTVGLLACSGALIDKAALRPPLYTLTVLMAAVQLLALSRGPLRYAERLVSHDAALGALGRVRLWLYDQIAPRSPAGVAGWRDGDLLARATADVDLLQDVYLRGVAPLVVAGATTVTTVAVVTVVAPAGGAVLAVFLLGGCAAASGLAWARRRHLGSGEGALRGELGADVVELLQAAPDLVAMGRDEEYLERALASDAALERRSRHRSWSDGAVSALVMLCTGGAVIGLLAVSTAAIAAHRMPGFMAAVLPLARSGPSRWWPRRPMPWPAWLTTARRRPAWWPWPTCRYPCATRT